MANLLGHFLYHYGLTTFIFDFFCYFICLFTYAFGDELDVFLDELEGLLMINTEEFLLLWLLGGHEELLVQFILTKSPKSVYQRLIFCIF